MRTPTRLTLAALATLLLCPAAGRAAVRPDPSLLALPAPAIDRMLTWRVPEASEPTAPETPVTLALAHLPAGVQLGGVHYQPRGHGGYRRSPESAGVSQVHLGFFDPDGAQEARFDLGIRGGPMLDENLQVGLGVDWIHKGRNISSGGPPIVGPGGVPIGVTTNLSRESVNMFPIMGFVQVSASDKLGVVPFLGAGGGYEVLVLSAEDFATGATFDGTFSGWGWQVWGGVGVPLGGRTRLTGEVFLNRAELGRDANDGPGGLKVHETVNADGAGLRFGVAWGF